MRRTAWLNRPVEMLYRAARSPSRITRRPRRMMMRPEMAAIAGKAATSFLEIDVLLLLGRGKHHNAAQALAVDPPIQVPNSAS